MQTGFSPDRLPVPPRAEYDVFLSFTRATPGSSAKTTQIMEALAAVGLRTFRDDRIGEFDSITGELVDALGGAKVFLAYYSTAYPTRYACQWELTAAWIAAQRVGPPIDRVLAVNPDSPADGHIAPVELADARFWAGVDTPEELRLLALRVRDKVAAAAAPLGAAGGAEIPGPIAARMPRNEGFVGRYREMWQIATAFGATDRPAVSEPAPAAPVVITGLTGVGKTALAARYAYLYRNEYPGGIYWVGLGDGDPETHLRDLAEAVLGHPVRGVPADRLPALVLELLARGGVKSLLVLDGVPGDLPATVLERILVPEARIRVLLTARRAPVPGCAEVRLGGLTTPEAAALLAGGDGAEPDWDPAWVAEVVTRSAGHPMALRRTARSMRGRHGLVTDADIRRYVDEAGAPVTDVVRAELSTVSEAARNIVRAAAVLARAPFPPRLVLGGAAPGRIGDAAEELAGIGLLERIGAQWSVHELATQVLRDDPALPEFTVRAGAALLAETAMSVHLIDHIRTVAASEQVDRGHRLALWRRGARWLAQRGAPAPAADMFARALELEPTGIPDLLAAAAAEIDCGRYEDAVEHARTAAREAEKTDDFRSRFRAGLLTAQALDFLGKYAAADTEFWQAAPRGHRTPGWMSEEESARTVLAMARAERLRGAPRTALELLDPLRIRLRTAPPGPLRDDLTPAVELEIARASMLTGHARRAREMAAGVAARYREAGEPAHFRFTEAEHLHAEAYLMLDLTELDGERANWESSAERLRALAAKYAEEHGPGNALTLRARVAADRASISLGRPRHALGVLAATDAEVVRHLGADHPLRQRIRHAMGQGHGQLREYARQAELLEPLLAWQVTSIGALHPDTLETRLDLGIALAMVGGRDARARALVDEAARELRRVTGWTDLSGKATTAQAVLRLPLAVRRLADRGQPSGEKGKR